jgi:hypothetical protein
MSAFHYFNKIAEIINFKKGKLYFGSEFRRVQPMINWLYWIWASGKASHHGRIR